MLKIWKISHVPSIKLVRNDIETVTVVPIRYEPPNTVVIGYLYDNAKVHETYY
jgi:hypothetical protein